MSYLACAFFLWVYGAIADWDGDRSSEDPGTVDVDDMPDVPPQLGR